jgi:hypothetical protein
VRKITREIRNEIRIERNFAPASVLPAYLTEAFTEPPFLDSR